MWWQLGLAAGASVALAYLLAVTVRRRPRRRLRQRERDALELNDNVLQALVVAKLAFELDERDRAMAALDSSIRAASRMVTDVLGPHPARNGAVLLRSEPAMIEKLR